MVNLVLAETALNDVFAALADPTRRAILARLAKGEATVNELAAPLPMSLPAVSKHLKVLEGAKLISRGRDAQWRPCRIEVAPLRAVDAWLARYREFWEGSFDKMDALLKRLQPPASPMKAAATTKPATTKPSAAPSAASKPAATASAAKRKKKGARR
jgi:DNA-binding transcriptional ArsR family regulator